MQLCRPGKGEPSMKEARWEDFVSYRKAWLKTGTARDRHLMRFCEKELPRKIYKGDAKRRKERAKLMLSVYQARYHQSESYKNLQKVVRARYKARRNEACHEDLNWVLSQFKVNVETGEAISPNCYKNPKTGYWFFSNVWGRTYLLHRVIWMKANNRFIPEGLELNHKDNCKDNNAISNLELVTRKENIHKYAYGKWGIERTKKHLNYVWDVLEFYYQQPYRMKIVNTLAKFDVTRNTLNGWAVMFDKFKVKSGKRDYYIQKLIDRRMKAKQIAQAD